MALTFSLVSSCVDLINDIVDREWDRHHPAKRNRPMACDAASLGPVTVLATLLMIRPATL